jgi:hypothetical protein
LTALIRLSFELFEFERFNHEGTIQTWLMENLLAKWRLLPELDLASERRLRGLWLRRERQLLLPDSR